MTQIIFPDKEEHRLVFYLAAEEYLAEKVTSDCDYFFVWQSAPTVIFGRNQDIEAEVNLDYCRKKGIEVFRRKSGGGCVYSDWGNIMLSYVTRSTNVENVFNHYLDMLADTLSSIGFKAVKTEHNDVLIEGKKVSGNAYYALPQSSIVHGTLLHSVDFEEMQRSITPSKEKLESHGVKSVRQRVVNISEISPIDKGSLLRHIVSYLCDSQLVLSQEDMKAIKAIEQTYLSDDFVYFGKK